MLFSTLKSPQPIKEAGQTKWMFIRYIDMSPFKAAVLAGVAIGLVAFIGIRFISNRSAGVEDDQLFV